MKDKNDENYKNDRKNPKKREDGGGPLESVFTTLTRSAPPEGLKERLFRGVKERISRERVMTPGMLKAVAASLAFAALSWGADFLLTRAEKRHLAALFNLNATSQVQRDTESLLLLEIQALTDSERLFFFSAGFRYPRPKKEGWRSRVYPKLNDMEEEFNGT